LKRVGIERFQYYYQKLHNEVERNPTLENLVQLGAATFFMGNDIYEAEAILQRALRTAGISPVSNQEVDIDLENTSMESRLQIGNALFTLGIIHQYFRTFKQSWIYYDAAAAALNGTILDRTQTVDEQIKAHISKMSDAEMMNYLDARLIGYSSKDRNNLEQLVWENRNVDLSEYPEKFTFLFQERKVPTIRRDMALNGVAYSRYLQALYEPTCDSPVDLLEQAIILFHQAIDFCVTVEVDMMYRFNLGKAHYYLSYYVEAQKQEHLAKAHELFELASEDDSFVSRSEAFSMLAQCYARENNMDACNQAINQACDIDPKVFIVNVDTEELQTPWPLPQDNYTQSKTLHQFQRVMLPRPRWCDHCLKFIGKPVAQTCGSCGYLVHEGCIAKVQDKHCWSKDKKSHEQVQTVPVQSILDELVSEEKTVKPPQFSHLHKLSLVFLHKPSWCGVCSQFIKNPVNNYRCTECKFVCHQACYTKNVNGVIVKK
jgi:hypothetical protein